MLTKNVFENSLCNEEIIKEHISYYLKEFVGYNISNHINLKKINLDGNDMYIVILKDDIRRINVSNGGTGVLRQKQWSIFIFNFIDSLIYEKFFGKNKNRKDIVSPFNNHSFDDFSYVDDNTNYVGEYPDSLFKNKRIIFLLQNYIFSKLFEKYRYLFLNSYVYSVIDIVDHNLKKITNKDFFTYYYNTNHSFRQFPSKKIINQKVDINKTSYLVEKIDEELDIIEKNYSDMLDLINAYRGDLPLSPITSLNYNSVKNDIEMKVNFIITEGMARTGKTIIAMRLIGLYDDAKLIIMNEHFYKSLKEFFRIEGVNFPSDRIACHTEFNKAELMMLNSSILIVDEAQRLDNIQIKRIIENNNCNINVFLGDNLQKLNRKHDKGIELIEKTILKEGYDYKKYYFDHSIGLSRNVLYSIKYLLFNKIPFRSQNIYNYEISIYDDQKAFINKYKNDFTYRKHIATLYMGVKDYNVTINGFSRWHTKYLSRYHYFLDKDIKESVMLTTYEMISRELDTIYIYLPNSVYADEEGLHFLDQSLDEYMLNQIYILMTRAKGSINILCENPSAYDYLVKRYQNLIKEETKEKTLIEEEKNKSNKLENQIYDKGITRLIHFTSADNIDSIYKNGIMSIDKMKEQGVCFDFNDPDRFDGVTDGISLSIQNPNTYLYNKFKEKYPNKKYVYIILDPALLYEITNDDGDKLANRYYCNYNAASRLTKKSPDNLEIMFEDTFDHGSWKDTRKLKTDDLPTTNQAEILFRQTIDPKYILEVLEGE